MFRILDGKAATYLHSLFSVRGTGYNIGNSEMRLNVPRPRTDYMKKSFCYSGAVLFINLFLYRFSLMYRGLYIGYLP